MFFFEGAIAKLKVLIERALRIQDREFGAHHIIVARTLVHLAHAYRGSPEHDLQRIPLARELQAPVDVKARRSGAEVAPRITKAEVRLRKRADEAAEGELKRMRLLEQGPQPEPRNIIRLDDPSHKTAYKRRK